MDKLQAERERGLSIDTKLRRLESRQYFVNIIDTPGHSDYVHNMITGSSQVSTLQGSYFFELRSKLWYFGSTIDCLTLIYQRLFSVKGRKRLN